MLTCVSCSAKNDAISHQRDGYKVLWKIRNYVVIKSFIRKKAQDSQDMLSRIFHEMKQIRELGGLKLTLDFGKTRNHDAFIKPVMSFIIEDFQDNDLLCRRKWDHLQNMKGLYRINQFKLPYGDNACICCELIYICHKKANIVSKSKNRLDGYPFLPIHTYFHTLSFGLCPQSTVCDTPAEYYTLFY